MNFGWSFHYIQFFLCIMGANNQLLRFRQSSGLLSHPCESKYFEGRYLHPYVYEFSSILRLFVVRKMPSMYNHVYIYIYIYYTLYTCILDVQHLGAAIVSAKCRKKRTWRVPESVPESCWPVLTILTHPL